MDTCKICDSNRIKSIDNGFMKVAECTVCKFHFILDYKKPFESSSTGRFSNTTTDDFNESLLNIDDYKLKKIENIAKKRSIYYSKLLNKKNFKILEIGCGVGHFGRTFEKTGVEYLGIDINNDLIKEGKKYNNNVINCDFFDLNTKDKKFDVIFCSQVLEHITEPSLFIKKVYSSLNSNGIFHVDVPNHDSLSGLIKGIFFKDKERYKGIIYPYHALSYNKSSLKHLLNLHFDKSDVFATTSTSNLYGQIAKFSFLMKYFFIFCSFVGKGNLLVGISQK